MRSFLLSPERHEDDAPKGAAAHAGEREATPPAPAATEDLTGRQLAGRFQLDRRVGTGLIGCVYEARRLSDGSKVAVKVLEERLRADANVVRRFARESSAALALAHPNIAAVYEHGAHEGCPYLCCEWVEGEALPLALRRRPLTLRRALSPLCEVLSALSAAHRQGVIHGCLKPTNVLLREGGDGQLVTKLVDFGMGRLLKPVPGTGRTKYGAPCVAIEYVAPEQIERIEIDGRADVYSVGVLLYELLTGEVPFAGANFDAVLQRRRSPVASHPRTRSGSPLPRDLEAICSRALAVDPSQRYQSPLEMARAMRAVLDLYGARADLPLEEPHPAIEHLHTVSKDRLTMPGEQLRSRHKLALGALLLFLVCAIVWLSAPHRTKEASGTSSTAAAEGEQLLRAAEMQLLKGNPEAAVRALEQAQKRLGEAPEVQRLLGQALLQSGQQARGQALLRRYLQAHPDAPDAPQLRTLLEGPHPSGAQQPLSP